MIDHILGTTINYQNLVPVKKKIMGLRKLQIVENLGFMVSFD